MTAEDRLHSVLERLTALTRVAGIREADGERDARHGRERSDGLAERVAQLEQSVTQLEKTLTT